MLFGRAITGLSVMASHGGSSLANFGFRPTTAIPPVIRRSFGLSHGSAARISSLDTIFMNNKESSMAGPGDSTITLPPAVTDIQIYHGKGSSEEKDESKNKRRRVTWEDKFALLRQYKKEHGHCSPPGNYVAWNGVRLGGWAATQRKEYLKYQAGHYSAIVNARRIIRLERVGFQWDEEEELLLGLSGKPPVLVGAAMAFGRSLVQRVKFGRHKTCVVSCVTNN